MFNLKSLFKERVEKADYTKGFSANSQCMDCQYSLGTPSGLQCIRFPPTLIMIMGDPKPRYVPVPTNACGEFKGKPEGLREIEKEIRK